MDERTDVPRQDDNDSEDNVSICKSDVPEGDLKELDTEALDGGWGWMIVVACFLGHVILVSVSRSMGVLFVFWMDKYNSNAAKTSWIASLFNINRMIAGPFVSMFCERWGCRRVVFVGAILYSSGCLLGAFANDIVFLFLTFSVMGGLGGGCILTPMFIMLNAYFHKKKGIAMALSTMGAGLGLLPLPPVITYMKDEFGHFGTMLFLSGLAMNTFVISALFRPLDSKLNRRRKPFKADNSFIDIDMSRKLKHKNLATVEKYLDIERRSIRSEMVPDSDAVIISTTEITRNTRVSDTNISSKGTVQNARESKCEKFKNSFSILKNVPFWAYGIYMAAMPCCIQVFNNYTPGLIKEYNYTDQQSALVVSIAGASDTVGRFIAGFIFDSKLVAGRRWPVHCVYGTVAGLMVLLNGFQKHLVGFIIIAILWGLFEAGYHGQRATILPEFIEKDQVSKSLGFMLFWQGLGSMVSPVLAGFLRDEFGTFSVCFYYGGSVMMFCALTFLGTYFIIKARERSHICSK